MNLPDIRGLGVVQDGFTKHRKTISEVEERGWREASGAPLMEAMEALQARAAEIVREKGAEEDS
jgi:hypothetical protein